MRTSRLVVTLLLVAVLVTFALQNTTPVLPLVFLGGRTVALPLAIWIMGAIALGSITALILIGLVSGIGGSPQKSRRRWRVQPEPEPRSPQSSPQDSSPRANPRRPPSPPPAGSSKSPPRWSETGPKGPSRRDEDWATWEQQTPVSQWEDWGQSQPEPLGPDGRPLSKRQRRDRQQAEETLDAIGTAWDPAAERQPFVPRGASPVEDALEDIATGWDDWDQDSGASPEPRSLYDPPAANPAPTAYSYRPDPTAAGRQDPIYAPPDPNEGDDPEESEGVYDADYRVIIPPYRPLEEKDENAG